MCGASLSVVKGWLILQGLHWNICAADVLCNLCTVNVLSCPAYGHHSYLKACPSHLHNNVNSCKVHATASKAT